MTDVNSLGAGLRIAIVGGGVSGLSAAYFLARRARERGARLDIHLFEAKGTLGGNADTVVVELGQYQEADGGRRPYHRWADLGVNDANLATYTLMKQVMSEIGYLDHMKPLQDTASYHQAAGCLALTDDAALVDGVSDPRFSLAAADQGRLSPLISVMHRTALDLIDHIGTDYTCSQYFQDCIASPRSMLNDAARVLRIEIQWDDPDLAARIAQVRDAYYYPRISAMYFTDTRGPACMPLRAPFEYYRMQEGGVKPDRRYFNLGAQTWLEALAGAIGTSGQGTVTAKVRRGEAVKVRVSAGGVAILSGDGEEAFDLCVMATHADDAAKALMFDASAAAYGAVVARILGSVRYTHGYAVCHTAADRLPENRNTWRTYNIPIRSPGDSTFPYRIDYVVNLHQNDPVSPIYGRAGLPVYFVSLLDDLNQVPRHEILDRVNDTSIWPSAWKAGLAAAGPAMPPETGYRHQHPGPGADLNRKAWTVFKHNVLDAACFKAQAEIQALNLGWAERMSTESASVPPPLLFGGGWTCHAGLQEQCLRQSQSISEWVLPGPGPATPR